jgi:hypothetical protein
MLAYLQNNDL